MFATDDKERETTDNDEQQPRKSRVETWDERPHRSNSGLSLIIGHHDFIVRDLACRRFRLGKQLFSLAGTATENRNEEQPCILTTNGAWKRKISADKLTCCFFDGFSILGSGRLEQQLCSRSRAGCAMDAVGGDRS